MIANFKIELDKSEAEAIAFLKSNKVVFEQQTIFGKTIKHIAVWRNLENPRNFKFKLNFGGPIDPWWGKCSLESDEKTGKTILSVTILPPIFFLVFAGFILLVVLYTIIGAGISTFGTAGFFPAIIIPPIMIGIVVLIWRFIAGANARKIKESVYASFNSTENVSPHVY